MWMLLAYDCYYPSGNNVAGIYSTEQEALDAKDRFLKKEAGYEPDIIVIEFQELGDDF